MSTRLRNMSPVHDAWHGIAKPIALSQRLPGDDFSILVISIMTANYFSFHRYDVDT